MRRAPTPWRVLVIGAVGRAGASVLREQIGTGEAIEATVACTQAFAHLPRGLRQAVIDRDQWRESLDRMLPQDKVVIVLDRGRHGREDIFWQPDRSALIPLMEALHRRGVHRLELIYGQAHAPNAAERRTSARLGYHLREARPAAWREIGPSGGVNWLERLAAWLLRTLIQTLSALGMRQ